MQLIRHKNDQIPYPTQCGTLNPASPFGFRFPVGDFSFGLILVRTRLWPGCGGLSCGLGVGPAGQLAVPTGWAFPLAYMPFIWVGSLFADPELRCHRVVAPE